MIFVSAALISTVSLFHTVMVSGWASPVQCLELCLSLCKNSLPMQKTWVWVLACLLGSSQLPLIPSPGNLVTFSGLWASGPNVHLNTCRKNLIHKKWKKNKFKEFAISWQPEVLTGQHQHLPVLWPWATSLTLSMPGLLLWKCRWQSRLLILLWKLNKKNLIYSGCHVRASWYSFHH